MEKLKIIFKPPLNKLTIILSLLIFIPVFLYLQNNLLTITNITIQSNRLPKSFDGYRIIHLSDLHGKSFGENQKSLVDKIKKAQPDLIVFTGDLVDARRYNEEHSIELMKQIIGIADVYYVTGNHEGASGKFPKLEKRLLETGVKILRNTSNSIKIGNDEIYIIGIDDPSFGYSQKDILRTTVEDIRPVGVFKILLSHRPEKFPVYIQNKIDVTFSGHAHGGQFRLPFIGGLLAPGQGILPKYTEGKYKEEESTLIVSRGLGNSLFPQRLFNRPEVVVVDLVHQQDSKLK